MREVVLRVPRFAVEEVLDRLLPLVPGGVREVQAGRQVELRMRGAELPSLERIAAAAGRWPHKLTESEVLDDWRERRVADYEPDVIGGRLVVRPNWAPPAAEGLIEIVLTEGAAFGGGSHPTTRTCLEMLLGIKPRGSFADLGCGTGVLAILAARLGWAPVSALDLQPGSVEAAGENARRNGVRVKVAVADLVVEVPPAVDGFAANVPAALHQRLAAETAAARSALISGFGPDEADSVIEAYAAHGLRERRRDTVGGWVVSVLERDLPTSVP
jgi:ribosomal protein L11 methyltransferase